jgi:hypothetical protein
LALALASATCSLMETPWPQVSFDCSQVKFFGPWHDGRIPDITKSFLAIEHPYHRGASDWKYPQEVHPNASVLSLGILLCELHFAETAKRLAKDLYDAKTTGDRFCPLSTCLAKLPDLRKELGAHNYYLATKACLTWGSKSSPRGEDTDSEDVNAQVFFHQTVVKRLEAATFDKWGIGLGNMGSIDSGQNEDCWGCSAADAVRLISLGKTDSETLPELSTQLEPSSGSQAHDHLAAPSEVSLGFDTSPQTIPEQQ